MSLAQNKSGLVYQCGKDAKREENKITWVPGQTLQNPPQSRASAR